MHSGLYYAIDFYYVQVEFVGEVGVDGGGLKRELFSILRREICDTMFDAGVLRHDVIALQVCYSNFSNAEY